MGNKHENSKAIVDVTLDNSVYLPGENITGKVEILFKEQSTADQFPNPKLVFSIVQHKHWESVFSSEDDKKVYEGELNKNYFLESSDNNKFKGLKKSFIYTIPNDILPSLEFPHEKSVFAFMRTYFCVQIPELGAEKQILIIIQKSPDKTNRILKIVEEGDYKNGGKIRVEASYPKYSFPILSIIPVQVYINALKSEVKIKEVNVNLKRLVEFKNKNSNKIAKTIKESMFLEKRKTTEKEENLLFNIPFKDGKNINYYFSQSTYGTKDEICCILPNVNTDIINVSYYIKISVIPFGFNNKNIELKLNVDFHSKGENKLNEDVFNNFGKTIVKINKGNLPIEKNVPNLNYNFGSSISEADLNNNFVIIKRRSNSFNKKSHKEDSNNKNINNMNNINNHGEKNFTSNPINNVNKKININNINKKKKKNNIKMKNNMNKNNM